MAMSQGVGYGPNPSLIDPWIAIESELIQLLQADTATFQEVRDASRNRLGRINMNAIQTPEDYFSVLRNNLSSDEDIVDFLISIMDLIQYHTEMGTQRYADKLIEHKKSLERYKIERAREQIYVGDKNFVGRTEELKLIEETLLTNLHEGKYKAGVSICGLGGLGKTSLAREACFRINHRNTTEKTGYWNILQIDLREKENLIDILRDTLIAFNQMCSSDDESVLSDQLKTYLEKGVSQRTILLYDNLDDLMRRNKRRLMELIDDIIYSMERSQVKISVLMTVRQKLIPEKSILDKLWKFKEQESRLGEGHILELELKPLKEKDAFDLLKLCTTGPNVRDPDDKACSRIIKSCGYSPLAIRSIAATIKSGFISPEMTAENLRSGKNIQTLTEVSKCLGITFDTLPDEKKEALVKLSIFHTAKFDAVAAAAILGEQSLDPSNPITFMTELDIRYLKSRHLVEIDDVTLTRHRDRIGRSQNLMYSLHPLVYEFLKFKVTEGRIYERSMYDAQLRFVVYFERKISEIGKKYDKNCMSVQTIFNANRVHIQNFYNMILKVANKDRKIEMGPERLMCVKRMHEMADLTIDDFQKFDLLKKWIQDANQKENYLEVAYWKIFQALKFFETDRIEIASERLVEVQNSVFPRVKAAKVEWHPVLGSFYYLKGRIGIKERKFEEALENFKTAQDFYESPTAVRHEYRLDLANVYNSIGCVYYKQKIPDLNLSRLYHEKAFRCSTRTVENYNNIDLACYVHNIGTCFFKEGVFLDKCGNKNKARENYEKALRYYDFAMRLDTQFHMEEFDGFAEKLCRRAEVGVRLGRTDKAEEDIERAADLRRKILTPPHDYISVTQHKVGDIKRHAGMKLYREGRKVDALNKFYEAIAAYETTVHLMKCGGLPWKHEEYKNIKTNHLWLLKQTNEKRKLSDAVQFYEDFESGKFDKVRKKRRTEKETTKRFLTHGELQALAASGQLFQAPNQSNNPAQGTDDSDDRDDDTVDFSDVGRGSGTKSTPEVKAIVKEAIKEDKNVLNFNAMFREWGDDVNSDLEGEEEHLEDVFVDTHPSKSALDDKSIDDLLTMDADVEENMEVDESQSSTQINFDEIKAEVRTKTISRRMSEISMSSQDSFDQDTDLSKKREAFKQKRHSSKGASRDEGFQSFLEESSTEDESSITRKKPLKEVKKTYQQIRNLARQQSIHEDSEYFAEAKEFQEEEEEEEENHSEEEEKQKRIKAGDRRKRELSEEIPTKVTKGNSLEN
ncbi:hypothetical protein FSP39_024312 [Pinctada imbricata]|uniref:NB-ARC domain-containing protein n=1 Tax=Pinctada imbricata TaxID=66713 RepID=A0AA89C4G5_PINIB|nr:hypothetical protein FSP39_024312 [Pinctada imbricata]